jgi:hypothetical protein
VLTLNSEVPMPFPSIIWLYSGFSFFVLVFDGSVLDPEKVQKVEERDVFIAEPKIFNRKYILYGTVQYNV